ncbi:hypothetical protein BgiBS90_033190 [Biomphalaria glabrata]|nr:hypothetical protein BgiBS90_033190 [Biomphalaria glabrata]
MSLFCPQSEPQYKMTRRKQFAPKRLKSKYMVDLFLLGSNFVVRLILIDSLLIVLLILDGYDCVSLALGSGARCTFCFLVFKSCF